MVFNQIIPSCYYEKYTFEEERGKVWLDRYDGEKILFFLIDPESNPLSKVRRVFGTEGMQGDTICDLLILYGKSNKPGTLFCLVEVKTNYDDVKHAVRQLTNTRRNFMEKFNVCDYYNLFKPLKWVGYIFYYEGSSQQNRVESNHNYEKMLRNSSFDYARVSNISEIGTFFREVYEGL